MNRYGISVEIKNVPSLDPEFTPMLKYNQAFLENAKKPYKVVKVSKGAIQPVSK